VKCKCLGSLVVTLLPLLILSLVGCSATKVTGVWRNPEVPQMTCKNILVVSSLLDETSRKMSEQAIVDELQVAGTRAAASYRVLPEGELPNVERVAAAVQQNDFDAVLITRIVKRKENERVVAIGCPGQWQEDYRDSRNQIRVLACRPTPETLNTQIFVLATSLYRTADKAKILTITSDTTINMPNRDLAQGFASAVVGELRRAKVLGR